ncbi:helix-turn-helix domain-containing protein [Casimicrobium huifangae]|uniref:helix-turn-helix domain-containing protein n=1 Tax=Casimicrobium huifangae TaxID=2591109 RepID=UPI00378345DF
MSIKLMSKVFEGRFSFEGGPSEPTMKLVLLALADHASDTGEAVYPSIAHMCAKTGLSRQSVKNVLAMARKVGILTAIGRRRQVIEYRMRIDVDNGPKWNQDTTSTRTPDVPVPGHQVSRTRTPGVHVTINEPSVNHHGADAQALPSGRELGEQTRKPQRDALDVQADFERLAAAGRARGADRTTAAHPLAGRWPHLVDNCRAFEEATGTRLADLPKSQVALWAKQLEGHYQADITPDDERELVRMAKAEKWKLYTPGSADKLIGHLRRKATAVSYEREAKPLY